MLFLIVGRTASGKDYYSKRFNDLKKLVSYTTRPKRNDDQDDSHIFINEDDFEKYKKDIIAYSEINNYKYFTLKKDFNECDYMIIDPKGIKDLVKKVPKEDLENLRILYLWAKTEVRKERTKKRDNYNFDERDQNESPQFDEFEKEILKNKSYCGIRVLPIVFRDKTSKKIELRS